MQKKNTDVPHEMAENVLIDALRHSLKVSDDNITYMMGLIKSYGEIRYFQGMIDAKPENHKVLPEHYLHTTPNKILS